MHARALAILLLLCGVAQAQIYSPGAANVGNHGPICPGMGALCAPVPAVGFTAPGDIQTFAMWFGLRAYSAAKRGTKAVQLCNVGDVACTDINSDATTGAVPNTPTVGLITCGSGANQCTIKTWYDQTAGGACGGTCDATQATEANRPKFTPSCAGLGASLPCATAPTAGGLNIASYTHAQPISGSLVAIRTSGTADGCVMCESSNGFLYDFWTSSGQFLNYAGTVYTQSSITENTWHAIQLVTNGASSSISADGTGSTGSSGAGTPAAALGLFNQGGSRQLVGNIAEAGLVAGTISAGNVTSLNSNQHTFWGF